MSLQGAARGVLSIGTSAGLGQVIGLAAVPFLSRLYAPGEFGIYATLMAFAAIFSVVGPLRLESALPIAAESDVPTLASVAVLTSLGAGIVCAALVRVLAPGGQSTMDFPVLAVTALLVFSTATYSILTNLALRDRRYRAIADRNVFRQVGTTGGQLVAAPILPTMLGLALGTLVGQLAAVAVFYQEFRGIARGLRRAGVQWGCLKRYWQFPLVFAPAALLNSLGVQVPQLFITSYFGAEAGGNLFQALRIGMSPVVLIGSAVSSVILAELSTRVRAGERSQRRRFLKAARVLGISGLLWLLVMILVAPPLLPFLLGEGWGDAGRYAAAVAVQSAAVIAISPLSVVLIIYERAVLTLTLDVLRVVATVGAGYLGLTAGWGAVGTSAAMAGALAAVYAVTWFCCLSTVSSAKSVPAEL